MLINEVCRRCGLTKKAVEYYVEQELLTPLVLETGIGIFGRRYLSASQNIRTAKTGSACA